MLDRSLLPPDPRELPAVFRRWPLPSIHHRLARRRCLQHSWCRAPRRFADNDDIGGLLHDGGYCAVGTVLLV